MWNFWKKASKESTTPKVKPSGEFSVFIPEETLQLADTKIDGKPYVCLLNTSILDLSPKDPFRWYLSLIIRYEKTVGDEMPDKADAAIMQDFTDYLHDLLADDKDHPNALYLGRVTGAGKTPARWYVNNPEKANSQLQAIIKSGKYPLQFEYVMDEDPDFKEAHWWLG